MTRSGGYRQVCALSVPIAGVQLAGVALTTTDVAVLQTLGVVVITGGGLAMQLYNQIRTMCVGMVTACSNLVAEATAAPQIRQRVRASFAVGTATAVGGGEVLMALAGLVFALPVDREVAWVCLAVAGALAPGLVPMMWMNVLRQTAVGMGRPGSLVVVTVASIVVNGALDVSFVALAPTPLWGAVGVGCATSCVQAVTVAAYVAMVRRDAMVAPVVQVWPRRGDAPMIRQVVRLGIPVSLTYGSEAALTTVAAVTMGALSPELLAAHTVVNQIAYVVYQVCIGFSHGGSVLVSAALRQGRAAVVGVSRRVLVCVVVYLTVMGVAWVLAGRWVVGVFLAGADAHTVHSAAMLLYFAVAQQYAKGLGNVLVGLLRGVRDTVSGLRATTVGYWVVGVPALVVLGVPVGWGGYGVWAGLVAGFATTAGLLARTYRRRISALPETGLGSEGRLG